LDFVLNAGYLQIADANDIVVLFPQVGRTKKSPSNYWGAWDWFGYDGKTDLYGKYTN
jgi:hypothetical protein